MTSKSRFENLTKVWVKNPGMGKIVKLTFHSHQMYISTHLDAKNTMVFLVFRYLCWKIKNVINIFLKAVIFYLMPKGSLLVIRFTSNRSTPLLELSTGFSVLYSDLPWLLYFLRHCRFFLAKYLLFGKDAFFK